MEVIGIYELFPELAAAEPAKMTVADIVMRRAAAWLEAKNVRVTADGRLIQQGKFVNNIVNLRLRYSMEMAAFRNSAQGINKEVTEDGLDAVLSEIKDRLADRVYTQVAHNPTKRNAGRQALEGWLTTLTGKADPLDVAVMEHFIYQVKRRLSHKPTKWHMMPVFTGPQGTGKSVAVDLLLGPVKTVTLTGKSVDFVTDEKHFKTMAENFVCFFDEMSKASSTDVDKLKQILSAETLDYRPLYTNDSAKATQNCTFIGVSNRDLRDLIHDTTGMRRFYQIQTRGYKLPEEKPLRDAAWAVIQNTDYKTIWQAVDETQDLPSIADKLEELSQRQESLRHLTSIEEFLEERALTPGTSSTKLYKDLYNDYRDFCKEANRKDTYGKRAFNRELSSRGFETKKTERGMAWQVGDIESAGVGKVVSLKTKRLDGIKGGE